jgi:L-alanine-DL-glutamate epimerase-like enolase superfamily enzyme
MPWLAALVCCSAFDIALHDAYGQILGRPVYETYNSEHMSVDLAHFLEPAPGARVSFAGKYPADFSNPPPSRLPAWHLVGGKDLLDASELTGSEPDDGYPSCCRDWIERDGLKCLKVKLRGNDARLGLRPAGRVGRIASSRSGVDWLTTDFNCTVTDPAYVNDILDRLMIEHPRIYG